MAYPATMGHDAGLSLMTVTTSRTNAPLSPNSPITSPPGDCGWCTQPTRQRSAAYSSPPLPGNIDLHKTPSGLQCSRHISYPANAPPRHPVPEGRFPAVPVPVDPTWFRPFWSHIRPPEPRRNASKYLSATTAGPNVKAAWPLPALVSTGTLHSGPVSLFSWRLGRAAAPSAPPRATASWQVARWGERDALSPKI